MTKTHWKKFFHYDYLGSHDLEEGQELTLTITGMKTETVKGQGGKEDVCPVLSFKEVDKGMILNRVNAKAVEKVAGSPYAEDWRGVQVIIFVEKGVKAFGTITDALRIRDFPPQQMSQADQDRAALLIKVRAALKAYKGDDREDIRQMLIDKYEKKEDTLEFLANVLKSLQENG